MDRSPSQRSRRRPGSPSRRARQRRLFLSLVAIAALTVVVLVLVTGSSGGPSTGRQSPKTRSVLVAHGGRALTAPISGESVVATQRGPLILGGLDSSGSSVTGVFLLHSSTGELSEAGSLTGPLHDSAATALNGRILVFGGGTETSTDAVQALSAPGGVPAPETEAETVGELPTLRSDLSAVTIGGTAYVLGGYDGSEPIASVLATRDGSSFHQVAKLPVPGRYLAVATLGDRIYAFGGETADGSPSDAIQEVDVNTGTARVVGHLAAPISHAGAVSMDGGIYVLGGEDSSAPTPRIWRFDPETNSVTAAGRLPKAVSGGGAAVVGSSAYLIGGTDSGETASDSVLELRVEHKALAAPPRTAVASRKPFVGRLMIADRGNDRLLVVDAEKHVLWRFPSKAHPAPPGGFYFPDDAFFTHGGTQIISNEEQNERIVQLSFPAGKLLWSYGHPGVTGSEPGYLHEPDDAYLLGNGNVSVADAQNCRVLLISHAKKIVKEFGSPESCSHEPPHLLGSPNGDTPLADGNILISEVNGSYIDEITPQGKVVWSVELPIEYPSDPQQLGPDRYLVADYTDPGGIYEFNRAGKILWSYSPRSGKGMLNHPSLAERLPNGLIATNDDYRDRVVIIDPKTKRIVWQYGVTGEPGLGFDHLHIPDGFDLLAPDGTTPTHPFTG